MHPQCPHRPTFCVNSNLLANHRSRFLGLNADLTQNWRIWAKTRSWNDASWCLRGWGGRCGRDGLRIGWRPDCTTSALAATDNSTHLPYPSQHHPRHTNEDGWMIKMECDVWISQQLLWENFERLRLYFSLSQPLQPTLLCIWSIFLLPF